DPERGRRDPGPPPRLRSAPPATRPERGRRAIRGRHLDHGAHRRPPAPRDPAAARLASPAPCCGGPEQVAPTLDLPPDQLPWRPPAPPATRPRRHVNLSLTVAG